MTLKRIVVFDLQNVGKYSLLSEDEHADGGPVKVANVHEGDKLTLK